MSEIRPFRIEIPQAELDDLHDRLARTRWPDELSGVGWDYGIPLGYLKELADYWRTSYDWRVQEARLNRFPQFMTTIDGADVHVLHLRSPEPHAVPLILAHGWPGSIVEFMKIVAPLADPAAHGGDRSDGFHVVCPSIPGYGFSGPTHDRGWDVRRVAKALAELMARLGYERYGAHGSDWGSRVARELSLIDAGHLFGIHVVMMLSSILPQDRSELKDLSGEEQRRVQRQEHFRTDQMGYGMIQSTRPQTLAYGLTDSPVGQLAWIVEKFKEFTDSKNLPEDAVDRDQMLTNVMLYWLTRTAGSSGRLYFETSRTSGWGNPEPSAVPTGVAVFPQDISIAIRRFAERGNNIVHWSEFDRGGHFPAMEEPDLLVGDLRTFFRRFR